MINVIKQITCPHCSDTYPEFDAAHVCSRGPYAPKLKPKMNERIRKLAEQAEEYALSVCDNNGHFHRIYREKFAELVVRECMDLASAEQKRYANITHRDMNECAVALGNFSLLIKDHFEDEE